MLRPLRSRGTAAQRRRRRFKRMSRSFWREMFVLADGRQDIVDQVRLRLMTNTGEWFMDPTKEPMLPLRFK